MKNRSCLVTGGAGFIGSYLVQALARENWNVRVLVRRRESGTRIHQLSDRVEVVYGDFGDAHVARRALAGIDTLFHYASTTLPATAYGNSSQDVATNLLGTLVLLDEALAQGCNHVVFPSSGGTVYGILTHSPIQEAHQTKPICSHGIVKLSIEHYLHLMSLEKGLQYTILRYANPYGPRQLLNGVQGAVAVFANKILKGDPIEIWGDGSVVRDFIYIDDAVTATVMASLSDVKNQVFNIGCGVGVSLLELVSTIEDLTKRKATVRFASARPFDVPVNVLSIAKAKKDLGWSPASSLREGLLKTIEAISLEAKK
jgi:UDP-glucose 4-epimerase